MRAIIVVINTSEAPSAGELAELAVRLASIGRRRRGEVRRGPVKCGAKQIVDMQQLAAGAES